MSLLLGGSRSSVAWSATRMEGEGRAQHALWACHNSVNSLRRSESSWRSSAISVVVDGMGVWVGVGVLGESALHGVVGLVGKGKALACLWMWIRKLFWYKRTQAGSTLPESPSRAMGLRWVLNK